MMWLLFFLCSTLWAEARRDSSITLAGTTSSDEFRSQQANLSVGLSERWLMEVSYFQSQAGTSTFLKEPLDSHEWRVRADWQEPDRGGISAGLIARQDPFELQGRGVELSGRYHLNRWWKSDKLTRLKLKVEMIRFQQNIEFKGAFSSLNVEKDIIQRALSLQLDQDLTEWMSASLSATRYSYTEATNQLARITARRRTTWSGSNNYGLPDRTAWLELQFFPTPHWEFRLNTSMSKIVENDTEIKSNSAGVTYLTRHWELALDGSRTHFGKISGKDQDTQSFLTLALTYFF